MHTQHTYTFIEPRDALSALINDKANLLYQQLVSFNVNETSIGEFGKYYFGNHHAGKRLIFSIESSAAIIYNSVTLLKKEPRDLTFMDYGAGLGTLFLLAGTIGFKKVYFNDYFPEWAGYARIICEKTGTHIDDYICGDVDDVIRYGKANNQAFDIIASRNVVEHIYDLRSFYNKLSQSGSTTLCYSTTTANYHNIAMRLKHYWYHRKVERARFRKQRETYIRQLVPDISPGNLKALVALTRGRAFGDFENAVHAYLNNQEVPPVPLLGTNTCDCHTGVWAENLLTRYDYQSIIQKAGFQFEYSAGFWDTHYRFAFANYLTRFFNWLVKVIGKKAYWLTPFVNIVAIKE